MLDLFNSHITSLDNFNFDESLTHLSLSNNSLKELKNLPKNLQVLHCSNNLLTEIKDLPHSKNPFFMRNAMDKCKELIN